MKINFVNPYRSFAEALADKFSKWPVSSRGPASGSPMNAVWADLVSGVEDRLKRAAENQKNKTLLALGKQMAKQQEEERVQEQIGRMQKKA